MEAPSKTELLAEIHGLMRTKSVTQDALARAMGWSRPTVSRHLDIKKEPFYDHLFRMRDYLVELPAPEGVE